MLKPSRHRIDILNRASILLHLMQDKPLETIYPSLNVHQMQDLRNFLLEEIVFLSQKADKTPLTAAAIKEKFEPIPNYYYRQDCREPLDSCFNETCLMSNPRCFSNKMKEQLAVLMKLLKDYLPQMKTNVEPEKDV